MSAGSVVVALLASESGGATFGTTAGWVTYRYFVTTTVTFSYVKSDPSLATPRST